MRLAVTGKGGVGKSTFVALLARVLRDAGQRVIAVDADPDMNLAALLGVPSSTPITPIIAYKELIAERTGTQVGKSAPLFTMNPRVDDIPERFWVDRGGIKLLVMGTVSRGGGGCACPENAFLKALLGHLVLGRDEWVLMDMEAGIEHLGRGTAMGVDEMIVVAEPSRTSLETAARIQRLAVDLKIKRLRMVGNKVRGEEDRQFLRDGAGGIEIIGYLEQSEALRRMSMAGSSALEVGAEEVRRVAEIAAAAKWTASLPAGAGRQALATS
jgi:CO dehydrogenase maturation factor